MELRRCFHTQVNVLPHPQRELLTDDLVQDAVTGLRNVLFWDLAFILFPHHGCNASDAKVDRQAIMTLLLWTNFARYSDPNGPIRSVSRRQSRAWQPEFSDGLEHLLTIRCVLKLCATYAKSSVLRTSAAGCKLGFWSSHAMLHQFNFTALPPTQRLAVIALVNHVMSEQASQPSRSRLAYDEAVLTSGRASTLLDESSVAARNRSLDADEVISQMGPIIPRRIAGGVDALYNVGFASLHRDSPWFRSATCPPFFQEPLDCNELKRRPLQKLSDRTASSPLTIGRMVSTYACLQTLATHIVGIDDCLRFMLYRGTSWEDECPVMTWFHGGWAVSGDAWGLLGSYDGASLARVHSLTIVAV